jgi:formylglycine-generating enzyme required for sulfatase activity
LAVAGNDHKVRLWTPEGEPGSVFEGHTDAIQSIAWHPDGRRVLTGSRDGTARLWDVSGAGQPLVTLDKGATVDRLAWSPKGDRVLIQSTNPDKKPRLGLYSAEGKPHRELPVTDAPTDLAWDPACQLVAGSFWTTGCVRTWNAETGEPVLDFTGEGCKPNRLAWSPDGQWLAVAPGGQDRESLVHLWKRDGTQGPTIPASWDSQVAWLDSEGNVAICGAQWVDRCRLSKDGQLQLLRSTRFPSTPSSSVFDAPRKRLYSWGAGAIQAMGLSTGESLFTVLPLDKGRTVRIDPTGHLDTQDPEVEKEFVYYAEEPDGTATLYTPAEFRKQADAAAKTNGSSKVEEPATPKPQAEQPRPETKLGRRVSNYGPGSPPLAIAPFDAAQARKHQEAWAKHLGVPVEITNSIGMKLILIPPGEFMMGSTQEEVDRLLKEAKEKNYEQWYKDRLPSEGPQHRVRITKSFYLGVTEVTQEQYQRVVGTNPSEFSAAGGGKDVVAGQDTKRLPVEMVSWDEANEFCEKLSAMPRERATGRAYRLPTEAQWEYACRAGTTTKWFCGDDERALGDYAWYIANSDGRTHPVGEKKPTAWGLCDMHGNVWAWCQDWWEGDYYAKSPADDPAGPLGGSCRVIRGGSWFHPSGLWRSANRLGFVPGHRSHDLGLRVSVDLAE